MRRITRRDAIKQGAGWTAGLAVAGAVGSAAPAPAKVAVAAAKPAAITPPVSGLTDVTIAIRQWFVNRCPLLTRLNCVPVERTDFLMHDMRPATNQEAKELPLTHIARNRGMIGVGRGRQQCCQSFQFPVQIGGSSGRALLKPTPAGGGIQSPFEFDRTVQLCNMVDDIENAIYYGVRQRPDPAIGNVMVQSGVGPLVSTARMAGLRQIVTRRIPWGEMRPDVILRGFQLAIEAVRESGGEADLIVLPTAMLDGKCEYALEGIRHLQLGETTFGTPIRGFACRDLPGVTIIEAPLLRPTDAFVLTSSEVCFRNKVSPYWKQRPNRGDIVEGDWICEGAIDVTNESQHAFLTKS